VATISKADVLIGMTDLDLVVHTYGLAHQIDDEKCEGYDAFYFALGEVFERFAPEAARAELDASCEYLRATESEEARVINVEHSLLSMKRREAARKIAAALREQGVDDA